MDHGLCLVGLILKHEYRGSLNTFDSTLYCPSDLLKFSCIIFCVFRECYCESAVVGLSKVVSDGSTVHKIMLNQQENLQLR